MTTSAGPDRAETSHQTRDLTTDHRLVRLAIGAATVGAGFMVAAQHRANPPVAVLLVLVVAAFGYLSAVDVAEQRLPNLVTLPLAGVTILALLASGIAGHRIADALVAIAAGIGLAALLGALRFGMGDVKLAVTVGAIATWFGRDAILATIYIGAASGALVAIALMVHHRRRDVSFGFGPILAIGSVAGMLVAG